MISLPDLMAWKQFLFRISLGTQRKQNIISISGRSKDFSVSLRLEFQCFSNSKIKPKNECCLLVSSFSHWEQRHELTNHTDSLHIGTFHSQLYLCKWKLVCIWRSEIRWKSNCWIVWFIRWWRGTFAWISAWITDWWCFSAEWSWESRRCVP